MYCSSCGKEIRDTDRYCPGCGAEQKEEENKNLIEMNESKIELFMRKNFYKKVNEWSTDELIKISTVYSIVFVILQVIRVVLIWLDLSVTGLAFGEIFCLLSDWFFLSKLGVRGFWKAWGLFLVPIYLFMKAKKTDKKYIWGILHAIIMVAGVVSIFIFL